MKKENFTVKDKTEVALGLCGIAISIVALVVSWNTASITNQTSRQLLEYQLEQERLPRIVALNYRLPIEFARMDTYTVERRIDFSSVSKSLYPIRIPIYNVGVGFAQNCTITQNLFRDYIIQQRELFI